MTTNTPVVERNETITRASARGDAYDVRAADGALIGRLSRGESGWRILYAGIGVPFDQHTIHARVEQAVDALVATVADQTADGALAVDGTGLTKHQRDVLDFMGKYAFVGHDKLKAAIWGAFDVSPTRLLQEFNALLNNPAAAAYAPMVVNRHRRLRDDRAAARSAKRLVQHGAHA